MRNLERDVRQCQLPSRASRGLIGCLKFLDRRSGAVYSTQYSWTTLTSSHFDRPEPSIGAGEDEAGQLPVRDGLLAVRRCSAVAAGEV